MESEKNILTTNFLANDSNLFDVSFSSDGGAMAGSGGFETGSPDFERFPWFARLNGSRPAIRIDVNNETTPNTVEVEWPLVDNFSLNRSNDLNEVDFEVVQPTSVENSNSFEDITGTRNFFQLQMNVE